VRGCAAHFCHVTPASNKKTTFMNDGKICVSVCAETVDEFIENIKRAEKFADVIELRFDCLHEKELVPALKIVLRQLGKENLLITFRPSEQGGKRLLSFRQRMKFWELFFSKNTLQNLYVDFEADVKSAFNFKSTRSIASYHDFSGTENKSEWFYEVNTLMKNEHILKIAVQCDDIIDSIDIWKLLERAKKDNKQIIPIAMGKAGKWTRILGLAHGAFMTYASLDVGNETAPGQVSAQDLVETYRVKELNEQTEVYGIIGSTVSQSVSPFMHNAAFKLHNLNAVYIPFEVKNLDEFMKRMVKPKTREIDLNFRGFSVTIPHKQEIIKHLDFVDETALKIGAVNTVKIVEGKLHGYNTDAKGFIEPLRNLYGELKDVKVAVLGAGGAARAAVYALKNEGAKVAIFARDFKKANTLAREFDAEISEFPIENRKSKIENQEILVNTTPLGMKGKFETETPAVASQLQDLKLVYDLVYNPLETVLIKEARKANVPTIGGLAMLVAQGMKQFKIWTGKDAPMKEMSAAALKKLY
jgi:3-dehydroquinate dehydratase / shikimate dehydrogenase